MDFVLDASIALSWCFLDESNAYADLILDAIGPMAAVVISSYFNSQRDLDMSWFEF
ncbi:MAG: hypothetical protein ACYCYO_22955 [Bacilli bacterium]